MLIVDIIFGFLIIVMLFVFSFLFRSTVDARYERIGGVIASEDARQELFSVLQTEYQGVKTSDHIVAFCASGKDLKGAFESIKTTDNTIKIVCPDKKEFKTGSKPCRGPEQSMKGIKLVAQNTGVIKVEYC